MTQKQTLARYVMSRYVLAVAVTLLVMLCALLVLVDRLALNGAARSMLEDLRQVRSIDDMTLSEGSIRGGRAVLNADGRLRITDANGQTMTGQGVRWIEADRIIINGERTGFGPLPLAQGTMVWAARAMPGDHGQTVILVAWNRLQAIRAAAGASYWLLGVGVTLSFLVGAVLTLRMIHSVTQVLGEVTASGRRMAEGDFAVSLPEQPTTELDALTRVVSDLARHLDETLTDFRDEHTRLKRLEGAQRQFVADASHELRAPLSAISLTLAAWQDGLLSHEEQTNAVGQLRVEVMRLSRMVEQLLDLSRIESGRQPITLASVALPALVEQLTDGYALTPGAHILAEIPNNLPPVFADYDAVYRILRNLLDNARRFTPMDGMIRVWAQVDGDAVRLGVTDTGSGIPAASVAHVWDRFARAEQLRAAGDTGSGLGLAIVKALADTMLAQVGLESAEDEGTTVWLVVPIAQDVREA